MAGSPKTMAPLNTYKIYEPTKDGTKETVNGPVPMEESAWAVELRREYEERRKNYKQIIDELNVKLEKAKNRKDFNLYMQEIDKWEKKMREE